MRTYRYHRGQRGWWQALIPLAAAAISGIAGAISGKKANEANQAAAQKQMDFQKEMSSTSYQRGVADMKAAGLNPMLAYSQGGASAPSGSSYTAVPTMGAASSGVSSAASAMQSVGAIQNMMSSATQMEQTAAQTKKIESETMEKDMNSAMLAAQIKEREAEAGSAKVRQFLNEGLKEYSAKKAMGEADIAEFGARDAEERYRANKGESYKGSGWEADVARRKAEARLSQLDINEAEARSKFYGSDLGMTNPYMKMLIDLVKGAASARSLGR